MLLSKLLVWDDEQSTSTSTARVHRTLETVRCDSRMKGCLRVMEESATFVLADAKVTVASCLELIDASSGTGLFQFTLT